MAFTYDPSTTRGKVRMYIPDRLVDSAVFSDGEIDAFLSLYSEDPGKIFLAAADALEVIATDEALVLKVISNNGLSTNGASLANSLMQRSARMREKGESIMDDDFCGFDIAEYSDTPSQAMEFLTKEAIRNG